MNYCILPQNNYNVEICLKLIKEKQTPCISQSVFYYLKNIHGQLSNLDNINTPEEYNINYIHKIVNPFEFIYNNVPGTILSVSKVKPEANIFFELMEIFNMFNLTDHFSTNNIINICHLTHNHISSNYLLNMLREDNYDLVYVHDFEYNKIYEMFITNNYNIKLDLLICEFQPGDYTDTTNYIRNMLLILVIITKYQSDCGTCIIKIDNVFYKAIIDIIFILSLFYDNTIVAKPIISDITNGERYIVCKSYNSNLFEKSKLKNQLNESLLMKIAHNNIETDKYIVSLINNNIPYYFLSKLEESNIIIGQQQLESYNQIINICKNKNRDEKLEILKRQNIQKCIQWCEKHNLPHNKFIDNMNIFLTPTKKEFGFVSK